MVKLTRKYWYFNQEYGGNWCYINQGSNQLNEEILVSLTMKLVQNNQENSSLLPGYIYQNYG